MSSVCVGKRGESPANLVFGKLPAFLLETSYLGIGIMQSLPSLYVFESEATLVQSRPTPCGPMDCSHQAPPPREFSRQEYWSELPCPAPGNLPNPGIEPGCPALQVDLSPFEPPGKPSMHISHYF